MKNTNTNSTPSQAQVATLIANAKGIMLRVKLATDSENKELAKTINQELLDMSIFEVYLILKSMRENELAKNSSFKFANLLKIDRDFKNFDEEKCNFKRISGYLYNSNEVTGDGTFYYDFYQNGIIFEKYTELLNEIFMEVK